MGLITMDELSGLGDQSWLSTWFGTESAGAAASRGAGFERALRASRARRDRAARRAEAASERRWQERLRRAGVPRAPINPPVRSIPLPPERPRRTSRSRFAWQGPRRRPSTPPRGGTLVQLARSTRRPPRQARPAPTGPIMAEAAGAYVRRPAPRAPIMSEAGPYARSPASQQARQARAYMASRAISPLAVIGGAALATPRTSMAATRPLIYY